MKKAFIMATVMQNWERPIALAAIVTFGRSFASWASFFGAAEPVEPRFQVGDEVGNLFQSDMKAYQRPVVRYS